MNKKIIPLFLLSFCNLSYSVLALERPQFIKEAIETTFKQNNAEACDQKETFTPASSLHGEPQSYLMGMDDYSLVHAYIKNTPTTQKEFNILDLGKGNFRWGQGLKEYLANAHDLPSDIRINVISLRDETKVNYECDSDLRYGCWDGFTLAEKCNAKLENLDQILPFFNCFSIQKSISFDLIFSFYTLRTLADPAGTFIQAYNHLKPNGLFLFDGFYMSTDKNLSYRNNELIVSLLDANHIPFLMKTITNSFLDDYLNQFVVQRKTEQKAILPWTYKGAEKHENLQLSRKNKYVALFDIEESVLCRKFERIPRDIIDQAGSKGLIRGSRSIYDLKLRFGDRAIFDLFVTWGMFKTEISEEKNDGRLVEREPEIWCPHPFGAAHAASLNPVTQESKD